MADFKAKQKVQLFDGTNERGVAVAYPIYVQLSDGTDTLNITGSSLDVNLTTSVISVDDNGGSLTVDGTVTIQDGGGSISIDDGGGTITVDGSVTVSATDLDIRNLSETTDHVLVFANTAKDGTGTDYVPLVDADGHLQVDVLSGGDGYAKVDDSAFTIATDEVVPMGALADETATDSVDEGDVGIPRMTLDRKLLTRIVGATDANRLDITASGEAKVIGAANDGVDIGDVTINNAAGASAVNIQDGGNSITIDGTITGITNDVNIADGGNSITIDDGGGAITVDGSVTVSATDLDIRDLLHTQDSVQIGDGSSNTWDIDGSGHGQIDIAAVSVTAIPVSRDGNANSDTNPLFVQVVSGATIGTEIHDYDTASAVAKDASDNHDYTVTAAKTLLLKRVLASASGSMKIEIQTGPVAGLTTVAVAFSSPANPVSQVVFDPPVEVSDTSTGTVRVIRRNDDNQAMDVYSTIMGTEV